MEDNRTRIYDYSGDYMMIRHLPFDEFDKIYQDWQATQDISPVWYGGDTYVDLSEVAAVGKVSNRALSITLRGQPNRVEICSDFKEFVTAWSAFKRKQFNS